jgi:hypothetical protein
MPDSYDLVHRYQHHVERLRQEFAAQGAPKTHIELLRLVAKAEGARSWDDLEQFGKRSWLVRKLGWGARWRRDSIVYTDDLLYDLHTSALCLGLEREHKDRGRERVLVHVGWLRRGMLIVGPQGWGATTALEHYESQQLARGAGLLVLDASPNFESAPKLEKVAVAAGRSDFKHYRQDLPGGEALQDVAGLLAAQGAAYVNLPWEDRGAGARAAGDQIVQQLLTHARLAWEEGARNWPFMVVVREGAWMLTETWLPLVQYCRQLGILLVVRMHSMSELKSLPPEMEPALLNLLGAQLYLSPKGQGEIEAVAQALEPGKSFEELTETRKRLGELGMGEALMKWAPGPPQHLRLCMMLFETREEYFARRCGEAQ